MTRFLSVIALVAETVAVAMAVETGNWLLMAISHIVTAEVLIATALGLERFGLDSSQMQKTALFTFAAGPIGTAAAIISDPQLWRTHPDALQDWYRTISPPEDRAVTLVDQIIDRRLVNRRSRLPRRFDTLLTSGSMAEKQAVLAHLALESDNPKVAGTLRLALRSNDQRVRVQAAAVAAHVRDKARQIKALPAPKGNSGVLQIAPPKAERVQDHVA